MAIEFVLEGPPPKEYVYMLQKDVLESASKMVDQHLQADNSFSELIDCLKMSGELPKVSGLSNEDYPGVGELGIDLQPHIQLNVVKRVPLPSELIEQFGFMQSNCQMGLFPEIGRAWLTIDSNIFLWSFHDGSDLAYFDGINEVILCVGLVKPKPDVFQSFIHYLLCLATPTQIVLLGVSFSREHDSSSLFEEMHLLPEPLFSFPTDDTIMSCFAGANNGRIFLGGRDGCIYEFTYQAAEGWFRRKCRKINHSSAALSFLVPNFLQVALTEEDGIAQIIVDNSRNILYVRSEKGSIQVFDLGDDGLQMNKVISLHHQTISNKASAIAETVNKKNFSPVVNICVVEASESYMVNLVAVTQTGVRLYFTTNPSTGSVRPYTLSLLHVRLPPGFSARAAVDQLSNVHMAVYKKGFSMMAASVIDEHDVLFIATNDLFVFHRRLIETYAGMKLDGHTWALCEIPTQPELKPNGPLAIRATDPPLLITQHAEVPRQFAALSDQGCCIFSKPRPVDQLSKILLENKGSDCEAVKAFFHMFQETQACAMCLVIVCSPFQDKQVSEWAIQAFFTYGGNPSVSVQISDTTIPKELNVSTIQQAPKPPVWASTPMPNEQNFSSSIPRPHFSAMGTPLKSIFSTPSSFQSPSHPTSYPLQQQPLSPANASFSSSTEIRYSGKHNGIHLYFSRIIRPIWNLKLAFEKPRIPPDSGPPYLCSSVSSEVLTSFLQQLAALKDFLHCYLPYFGTSSAAVSNLQHFPGISHSPVESQPHLRSNAQSDAEFQERTSVLNLQVLVNYTYEALGLWKVLCDHQFEAVTALLSPVEQDQLKQFTFRELVVDGMDMHIFLTSTIIQFYLEDNASTSAISQRLQDVCPSIFRTEDAAVSKATEIIMNAKTVINADKQKELMEALNLVKSACPAINLKSLCMLFNENRFYHGIVDLSVCMAQRLDPQGLALHYYDNGEPTNDHQGSELYQLRTECYKVVVKIISDLVAATMTHPQVPCVPPMPGQQPAPVPCVLTPEEAKRDSETLFEMVLKTNDELFHIAIYNWLIDTDQPNALLSVKSHFLENYLKRRVSVYPESVQSLDLLWKYYEKNQNFSAAARVLAKLADKHGVELCLKERLEYLSRAMICIKSSEMRVASSGEGEFLHELEEKMEVARIQLQMLHVLQVKKLASPDVIAKLNQHFLEITQLYEEFAVPYDLPESKLAIIHCAGHYDPGLVESLWQSIIDKELIDTCGNVAEAKTKLLQQKFQTISQPYVNSEKYFPIAFILEYLEFKTCTMNLSKQWVYQIMLAMGFSLTELLSCYNKMYRTKDSFWLATKPLHLLQVLYHLITEFISNPSFVHQNERRTFITHCLDVIAGYLVDLQAMSTTNTLVPKLIKEFKTIQHQLERLL